MRKLLFFHAPWCPPCRFYEKEFILPLIQMAGADKVQKINAQEAPFTADKYSIDKLPAIVLLDGEQVKMNRTGAIELKRSLNFWKGVMCFDRGGCPEGWNHDKRSCRLCSGRL